MGVFDSMIEIAFRKLEGYRAKCAHLEAEINQLKLERFRQRSRVDVGCDVTDGVDRFVVERIFFDDGPDEDTVNVVCRRITYSGEAEDSTTVLKEVFPV